MHWAAWRGKVRTIEELIDLAADVEAVDLVRGCPGLLLGT